MWRLFANCTLLLAAFFLPPYGALLVIFGFIFIFDAFVESVAWAFVLDILYGGGGFFGIHFDYLLTAITIAFFLSSFQIKRMLTFYPIA